ncbi:diablo IAP-binding mitochondrial protein-like [Pholidichthys leucotaenia]
MKKRPLVAGRLIQSPGPDGPDACHSGDSCSGPTATSQTEEEHLLHSKAWANNGVSPGFGITVPGAIVLVLKAESLECRSWRNGQTLNTRQVENLSYDSLIRRAASLVTDSSSTFLSQTTLAFIDALANYSKAVHTRIAFQRQYLASLGKMTPAEEDSLQRAISSWRAEASERLDECKHYESAWINAVNLSKMAAEAAEASGAQQASFSLRTSIQVAKSQVEEARKLSADAEKKLAETKVEEIQRMAEYAASLDDAEEHEVHEAYLRED